MTFSHTGLETQLQDNQRQIEANHTQNATTGFTTDTGVLVIPQNVPVVTIKAKKHNVPIVATVIRDPGKQ